MFLFPGYLALLALGGAILALYFLKSRPTRQSVPSNVIWRLVLGRIRPNSFLQRFQNSIFLLLQLLVLLLLTLALARPAFLGSGGLLRVVIIDQSASMQAVDLSPSRWHKAVERSRELIRGHRGRISLWTLGDRLTCRLSPVDDGSVGLAALERLHPTHLGTPSESQILRMLRDLEGLKADEIYLLTDTPNLEIPRHFLPHTALHVEIFAREKANCAVVDAEALWNPARKAVQARITIANENLGLVVGSLKISASDTTIPPVDILLDPGARLSVPVELPGSGPFRFDLQVPDAQNWSKADDVWFLCDAGVRPVVALDAPKRSILHRLGSVLPLIEFRPLQNDPLGTETVALLTTSETQIPAGISGLTFAFRNLAPAQEILRWEGSHPLMRFINWDAVASGALLSGPLAGSPLLEGVGGTVISEERSRHNHRSCVRLSAAFDPDDPSLQDDVFLPVFLYNSLEYLLRERFPRLSYRAGQDALSGLWKTGVVPDQAGLHEIPGDSGKRVAVNLGLPSEARLEPGKPRVPGEVQKMGQELKEQGDSPWGGLLSLGIIVLLGEWYLFIRRN